MLMPGVFGTGHFCVKSDQQFCPEYSVSVFAMNYQEFPNLHCF
jgi:hypothetical protein